MNKPQGEESNVRELKSPSVQLAPLPPDGPLTNELVREYRLQCPSH